MLKYTTRKIINLQEFDDLVSSIYNRPYSFQQQDGCKERQQVEIEVPAYIGDYKNTTIPEIVNHDDMGVSFAAWLARDPEQLLESEDSDFSLELWWHRNFYPDVGMIINDLHAKGLIEAGTYYIDIDW